MENIKFEGCNVEIAKNQKEYKTLHAFQNEQVTVTCYRLSFRDRIKLLFTGKLWLGQMNFGQPLQPQLPTVDMYDVIDKKARKICQTKVTTRSDALIWPSLFSKPFLWVLNSAMLLAGLGGWF